MTADLPTDLLDPHPSALARRAWVQHLGGDIASSDLRARLTAGGSLPAVASETAARHPQRPAVRIDAGWWTHGELDATVARVASILGVRPGQRVLLAPTNTITAVVAYLAILQAGATVVLANPGYTTTELERLVELSGATVAVAAADTAARLEEMGLQVRHLDAERGHGLLARGRSATPAPLPEIDGHDTAVLAFTSGTTGAPKAVPLSHAALLASTRGVQFAWRWQATDVLVHALPLSHQHGLSGVHLSIVSGSATRILPRFDPGGFLDAVGAEGATVAFAVPSILERLLDEPSVETLAGLRLLTCGSAPLPATVADRCRTVCEVFPLERYGSTEAGLNLSNLYEGDRRPGTVGVPLPGVEIAVIDADGRPVASGAIGELLVRGPQVFGGYAGAAEGDGLVDGGWFRTGDLVEVAPEDGWVAILGRSKHLIITGGMKVHPREIEDAIRRLPGVHDAAVVGVPSSRWGEEVVAAVVVAEDVVPDEKALRHALREHLAPFKLPKRVRFVAAIPRNAAGKTAVEAVRRGFDEHPAAPQASRGDAQRLGRRCCREDP